jgi:MoxR-like ATPase
MTESGDLATVQRLGAAFRDLKAEIGKVIVGQDEVIDQLLMAIFAKGHCLLEGRPGLAKTLMVSTARPSGMTLSFKRVQFTPDLMPSDITGTEVIRRQGHGHRAASSSVEGPAVRATSSSPTRSTVPRRRRRPRCSKRCRNVQVTVGGKRHDLPDPFFVLATQNPIEQEGTYQPARSRSSTASCSS